MAETTLLPEPKSLRVEYVTATEGTITLVVSTIKPDACCPLCGYTSARIHSRYQRTVQDLPWQGIAVRLTLRTRRFFCDNRTCERAIFTERLPGVVARYARRTERLQAVLYLIGYALGGEAGARVAAGLGLSVSSDTLLRRVRQTVSASATTPRVLGVDDWAFRKSRRYGTILVDLERHCLVDLLPDRSSENVSEWLKAHPGVEIVSRDRSDLYAEGARMGAPGAQHVADRWHLLKNLGETLERVLQRHHRSLREVAQQMTAQAQNTGSDAGEEKGKEPSSLAPTAAEVERAQQREKRAAKYALVRELHRQGYNLCAIGRQTGLARKTIRKYLQAESCPYYPEQRRPRGSIVTPFLAHLKRRWEEGCHNAAQLFREAQAQGYRGRYTTVRERLKTWRARLSEEERRHTTGTKARLRVRPMVPSAQTVRWWLLGHYSRCDPEQRAWQEAYVTHLQSLCPEIQQVQALAEQFGRMVRERLAGQLESWCERVQEAAVPELQAFVKGLRQDQTTIEAALSSRWSNGQTEGQVNRLKMLKRQMYGRAKFDLLRARVLPMAKAA